MRVFSWPLKFFLPALLCVVLLGSCGPMAMSGLPFLGQADAVTVIGTDKTIADHLVSFSSGKNCSTVRRERGLHYCEEDEPEVKSRVHCYKTLGRVTCYNRRDPHASGARKLGDNNHNLVDPLRQRQNEAVFQDIAKQ